MTYKMEKTHIDELEKLKPYLREMLKFISRMRKRISLSDLRNFRLEKTEEDQLIQARQTLDTCNQKLNDIKDRLTTYLGLSTIKSKITAMRTQFSKKSISEIKTGLNELEKDIMIMAKPLDKNYTEQEIEGLQKQITSLGKEIQNVLKRLHPILKAKEIQSIDQLDQDQFKIFSHLHSILDEIVDSSYPKTELSNSSREIINELKNLIKNVDYLESKKHKSRNNFDEFERNLKKYIQFITEIESTHSNESKNY